VNFFNWIREGVRQAVLFGVSDAVGELGPAPNGEDMNHRILSLLRTVPQQDARQLDGGQLGSDQLGGPTMASGSATAVSAPPRRKRLGRTLGDIQASIEKTS